MAANITGGTIASVTTDSGTLATDFITNDQTLTVAGTWTANNGSAGTIGIWLSGGSFGAGVLVGSFATSATSGSWNFDLTTSAVVGAQNLVAGSYTITMTNGTSSIANAVGTTKTLVIDTSADVGSDLAISIPDTSINAAEKVAVAFTASGIDGDAVSKTVTFTDSLGGTVVVDASLGVADLSLLASGAVSVLLAVVDGAGNTSSTPGAAITLDTVNASSGDDVVQGTAGNDTYNGGLGNDKLKGEGGDDTLNGGDGDDKMLGGSGTNVMAGGDGNDTYYVDSTTDQVIEEDGQGADKILASVNYELDAGEEIEELRANAGLTGLVLTGNEFNNMILGGGGDDTLDGGGGNDKLNGRAGVDMMTGGDGDDTIYVDDEDDQVFEAGGGGVDTDCHWRGHA